MLIEDNFSDKKLRNSLDNILAGANRASNLSRQILNFNNKTDFRACPIKMQPIIREAIKLTRATLPANIKINHFIDNHCKSVMADSTHIHQITMNLITNAFQAMEYEGGILDVSLKETEIASDALNELNLSAGAGMYACLNVIDTGQGMDVSIAKKIFDPYFSTKERGTGLGLSVILNIVKTYGGNINFSSVPGKGSSFQVYIPIINSMSNTILNKNKIQKNLYGNESILLIDDEPFIIDVQQEIFERHGYTVRSFESSIDALNEFSARPDSYDIVMCDMTMPVMTGLALADKIRKIKSDIKIIICTGFSQLINADTYQNQGVDGFLMKPFKKQESLELIRDILDNR
jgi:CheY-like chemotaxis protein